MLGGGCSKRMQKPGRGHQHFSQNTANAKLLHYKAKRLLLLILWKQQMSLTSGFVCSMSWSLLTFPELLLPKNHDTKCWCHLRKSQRARVPLIGAKNAANIGLDQDCGLGTGRTGSSYRLHHSQKKHHVTWFTTVNLKKKQVCVSVAWSSPTPKFHRREQGADLNRGLQHSRISGLGAEGVRPTESVPSLKHQKAFAQSCEGHGHHPPVAPLQSATQNEAVLALVCWPGDSVMGLKTTSPATYTTLRHLFLMRHEEERSTVVKSTLG